MRSEDWPIGEHTRVMAYGAAVQLPHLGALVAFAIVERETGEPLQQLSATSNVKALLDRWDGVIRAAARKAGRS